VNRKQFCIYIIAPESGWPVKVGYSENLVTRLGQLQVGSWETLRLQKKYPVPNKSAAIRMERFIHKKLELLLGGTAVRSKRIRGEWFNVFVDDAIKAADDAFSYQKKLDELISNENWSEEKRSWYGYVDLGY
jgi:hypothetical protein